MARSLDIVILRARDCDDSTLKPSLLGVDGTRIVGELTEDDDLDQGIRQSRPDVLVLAVGGSTAQSLLERAAQAVKGNRALSIILAGQARDSDLLLSAMRSGVREFIQLPTKPETVLDILQQVLTDQPVRKIGKLMLLHGCGGGCGTSTLACNMAVEIALSGRGRVALVDLDLYRGQLAAMLDVFPTYSLLDLCQLEGDDFDHARLDSALLKHDSGVRLLARPKELRSEDMKYLSRIMDVIQGLVEMFDYVLVDMDLRLDTGITRIAEEFILVSQPVTSSIRNALEVIHALNAKEFDMDRVRVVLNRQPKKPGSVRVENVEKSLKRSVYWEIPEDHACVCESLNLGIPLAEHAMSSKVRCSVRDLAMALTRPNSSEVGEKKKKKGLFGKIFNSNVA